MRYWDFTRSPAGGRLLIEFGEERGVPAAQLLAGTGLALAQLSDPNAEIGAAQELRLTDNLLRALKYPPGLGFEVGCRYHFSAYGVWGYGLIASATLREAVAMALRFLPLTYAFTAISYRERDAHGVLTFGAPDMPAPLSRFMIERDMTAAATLLREMTGHGPGLALASFTLQAERMAGSQAADALVESLCGVSPEYGAHANRLSLSSALLDSKLPHANPNTALMCEQMCRQILEARRARVGSAAVIRHYLSAVSGAAPFSLEEMARVMNTSTRTLKRRLQEEGTTFRALLEESRGALAERLLGDERMSLGEIAERLGFSDLSSFSQAFKRWRGVPPSVFRAARSAGRAEAAAPSVTTQTNP
jgi:AraC-like DNA-binding protein